MSHAQDDPLAVALLQRPNEIDPQLSSPIFSNLATELREKIWRFALQRYEDLDNLYEIDDPFARPGQAAPLKVAVELLLTCRAVYVEAFLIPFQVNPIVMLLTDSPIAPLANPLVHESDGLTFLYYELKGWQYANISSVEWIVEQSMLEMGSLDTLEARIGAFLRHEGREIRNIYMDGSHCLEESDGDGDEASRNPLIGKKIKHLTIRLVRESWLTWKSLPEAGEKDPRERHQLEPQTETTRGDGSVMLRGYEARKSGRESDLDIDWAYQPWGAQVSVYWPDLETFELVLETFACKQAQLDDVVKCAKLWTFPVAPF
ncbi:hypothetical protein M426DRAFT_80170 [Hypoxylon sp. CI-4A]|nr:hypothetical protein M426DRAFT_80170 [Hypoxylon sp. CI-4A]